MTLLRVEIPMKLPSVSNLREHWAPKAARAKSQRRAVWAHVKGKPGLSVAIAELMKGAALVVTLTRIAPRPIKDKHDNLRSAFKAVVDQVAAELGVDDSSDCIDWRYAQEKGKAAVRIEIARMAERGAA